MSLEIECQKLTIYDTYIAADIQCNLNLFLKIV